jgi:hypothetical protein
MSCNMSWFTRLGRQKPPGHAAGNACPLGLCRSLPDFEALEYRPDLHRTCGHCGATTLPWGTPVPVPQTAIPTLPQVAMPTGNGRRPRRRRIAAALSAAVRLMTAP